ncbi:MAG: hypothetical protein Q3M30_10690 [Candidatus Electrothrix sp. Rat3]|nr:hypothetical protein [Candidatus Electrothrix rattekaaiensis]
MAADWLLREFSQPFLTQGNPPVTQDHPQGAQDNPLSPSPFSADGEIPQLILIIRPLSRWDFPYANFQLVQYQADNAFSNSS